MPPSVPTSGADRTPPALPGPFPGQFLLTCTKSFLSPCPWSPGRPYSFVYLFIQLSAPRIFAEDGWGGARLQGSRTSSALRRHTGGLGLPGRLGFLLWVLGHLRASAIPREGRQVRPRPASSRSTGPERQSVRICLRSDSALFPADRCQQEKKKKTEKSPGSVKSEGGLIRVFNSQGWNSILNFPAVAVKCEALYFHFSFILLSCVFTGKLPQWS